MSTKEIYGYGNKYKEIIMKQEYELLHQEKELSAKEMFKELGYKYSYDDGFVEYLKGEPVPDRLNTIYIKFKKISFDKMDRNISIYGYKKDPLCLNVINKKDNINDIYYLNLKELKAINKQVEELGWKYE